jgi:signal transduction histidine kinase
VERIFSQVVLIELFVCIVFIFTAGGIALKRGNRYARYFIAAWFTLLLGLILGILQVFGMIPTSFFTIYGYQIGSALEVIILSLGLADRINLMKKEKEEAQSLAMANQRLAIENLEKTNKTKDEFLANLSHELKTPLSVTYAYSEMLAGGNEYPEKVKKYAVKILDGAKILSNYFNDLLLVTDIESNLQLQKSDVDIASLMDKAVESYKLLLSEKEIELKMNSTEKINIHCDPILLEKAISAVVKNAIVYNKQGGKIEVNIDYAKSPVGDAYMHHSNDKSLPIWSLIKKLD